MVNDVADYIARDDPAAAVSWAESLLSSTDHLAGQPYSGRKVPEFNEENLRELVEGNYRVVYRIRKHAIYVQAVWHVRQNNPKRP